MALSPQQLRSIQDCVDRGNAAVAQNDFAAAISWTREAINKGGSNSWQLWASLGQLQARTGQFDDAAKSLRRAIKFKPAKETLMFLAKVEADRARWSEADACLAQAQALDPADAAIPASRGQLALQQKHDRKAGEWYRAALALAPENFEYLRATTHLLASHNLDKVVSALEAYVGNPRVTPMDRIGGLWLLAAWRERRERLSRGLWPMHATNVYDMGFHFVNDVVAEWHRLAKGEVERDPNSWKALIYLSQSFLALRQPLLAEPYFAKLRSISPGDVSGCTVFEPAFHAALDTAADPVIARLMPPSILLNAEPLSGDAAFFIGCDYRYAVEYVQPLLRSLARHHANIPVRLHIFDATPQEASAFLAQAQTLPGLTLQISFEWTGLRETDPNKPTSEKARGYYHVARYLRLLQFFEQQPGMQVYALDADLLFIQPPGELFTRLADHDLTMPLSPGRVEIQNQFTACIIGIAATAAARGYMRRVAGYLARSLEQGRMPWGLDQLALYAVYVEMAARGAAPDVVGLPPHVHDGSFGDHTLLWSGKCSQDDPGAPKLKKLRESLS